MVLKLLADASLMLWQSFEFTEAFKGIFEIGFISSPWGKVRQRAGLDMQLHFNSMRRGESKFFFKPNL